MDKITQYQCLKTALERLNEGGYVAIHSPTGFQKLDDVMDTKTLVKRIRGDIMVALRNIRRDLIDELTKEHNAEIGVDKDSDWAVDPFPIGVPKNDYRRHDADDGK